MIEVYNKIDSNAIITVYFKTPLVGVTGLEPATSRPPAVRASQLRHTPDIKGWVNRL
jgi:hypothetical protein